MLLKRIARCLKVYSAMKIADDARTCVHRVAIQGGTVLPTEIETF